MPFAALFARLKIDPYLLALIATVVIAGLFPVRGVGAAVLGRATYLVIAILFFLYGARLSRETIIAGVANWKLQLTVLVSTFILFPLLGLAITRIVGNVLPGPLALGLVFVCVLPSTVQSSIAFTSIARGNVAAAICAASLSNMVGIIATPALLALVASTDFKFSGQALIDLALQLFLPFALGQAVRPLIGGWIARHKPITSIFDRGSILVVVYGAFSAGMAADIWHLVDWRSMLFAAALDLILLALVLMITTFASRRLGFNKEDEIALVFCGSKKSLASGLPMANVLFPAQAVGLVVLPLMLFHQAQLFACSFLANRYLARRLAEKAAPAARSMSAEPAAE